MDAYDLIVVGGGMAGLAAGMEAIALGARVALVERDRLGGEHLWTGCVPSKALLACARVAALARDAGRYGVTTGAVAVDMRRVVHWVREAQRRVESRQDPERLRALGIDVIAGTARFEGPRSMDVAGRMLTAKRVVIATGSAPAAPPVEGLDAVGHCTTETIFDVDELPGTLIVLGAGPVGVELAQAFGRLGARVKLIDAAPVLLPGEEPEASEALAAALARSGVELLLDHRVRSVAGSEDRVHLKAQPAVGAPVTVGGNTLLVAAGRVARILDLALDRAGVELTREGSVAVDVRLRTTGEGVLAAGDVIGGPNFSHVAAYEGRLAARNALLPVARPRDYAAIPYVVFTDPELARVGLTEAEARREHGDRIRVEHQRLGDVDRALVDGATDGMVKLIADRRGRLLGASVLARGAGDMIGQLVTAIARGLTLRELGEIVAPYPSYAEAIRLAAGGGRFPGSARLERAAARWWMRR